LGYFWNFGNYIKRRQDQSFLKKQMPISPLRQIKLPKFIPSLPTKTVTNAKNVECSRLNRLPDELLLMIIHQLPNVEVLNMRAVNKHIGRVAQEIIRNRTNKRVQYLAIQTTSIECAYQEMLQIKKPQMDHFSQFLRAASNNQLQELSSYSTVPKELQIVGECLVTLKQGPLQATNQRDKWVEIRRTISRFEFKTWFLNLQSNLDSLDMVNVQIVREILMTNPDITYERVHEISVCGYNLLILIAASLQYAVISQELKVLLTEMKLAQEKSAKALVFLRFL
jgi:hypothetical protein